MAKETHFFPDNDRFVSGLETLIAKSSDFARIAQLYVRAVGPGDSVLRYLKTATAARGLFLALEQDGLIGITNFE